MAQTGLHVGRYTLAPLSNVRCDDLASYLGPDPGVYLCNAPEEAWYAHFGLPCRASGNMGKKRAMFAGLAPGSAWLSMTHAQDLGSITRTWRSQTGITHLGRGSLRGRLAQVWMALAACLWLWRHRRTYRTLMVYNFDQPQFLVALFARFVLRWRVIVDYEDDTTTYRQSPLKNAFERLMRRGVHGAVCIHAHMTRYFAGKPTIVINAFADVRYMQGLPLVLREGMVWLYSGRLDDIRGVDLIPDLVHALRAHVRRFTIVVTGSGPAAGMVARWQLPEVRYHGFVSAAALQDLTHQADACLILQRPDHPFSLGSYPSKIEAYAAARKPIYHLTLESRGRSPASLAA